MERKSWIDSHECFELSLNDDITLNIVYSPGKAFRMRSLLLGSSASCRLMRCLRNLQR